MRIAILSLLWVLHLCPTVMASRKRAATILTVRKELVLQAASSTAGEDDYESARRGSVSTTALQNSMEAVARGGGIGREERQTQLPGARLAQVGPYSGSPISRSNSEGWAQTGEVSLAEGSLDRSSAASPIGHTDRGRPAMHSEGFVLTQVLVAAQKRVENSFAMLGATAKAIQATLVRHLNQHHASEHGDVNLAELSATHESVPKTIESAFVFLDGLAWLVMIMAVCVCAGWASGWAPAGERVQRVVTRRAQEQAQQTPLVRVIDRTSMAPVSTLSTPRLGREPTMAPVSTAFTFDGG